MDSIWKAPWGQHIDLDRIVAVGGCAMWSFGITCQLLDKQIIVESSHWTNQGPAMDYSKAKQQVEEWRAATIEAWTQWKNKNRGV